MASDNGGRRCVAYKKVETEYGTARRCARFSDVGDVDEASEADITHFRGLGRFGNALNESYKGMDLAIGAAAGLVGTLGTKWLANKFLAGKLPAIVTDNFPVFGAIATAAALYFGEKKSARGMAHAVGAILAGGSVAGWGVLKTKFPDLAEAVAFRYDGYGRPYGVLQNDYAPTMNGQMNGSMGGLIVDNSNKNLSDLAALSMMGDSEDHSLLGF